jgi:uncharacterized lipoprotein YbaY
MSTPSIGLKSIALMLLLVIVMEIYTILHWAPEVIIASTPFQVGGAEPFEVEIVFDSSHVREARELGFDIERASVSAGAMLMWETNDYIIVRIENEDEYTRISSDWIVGWSTVQG